ncbi:hypothetical protein LSH36_664g00029 [Paralvinella palmiformis]|uniref:B(0,+)-type amino acid transporter 1 n=1 Tax=Paralvinella palmiformis TaxID=53620 RepID=A0AAD9J437_9ANNE|nr:hypothetical protein LSH36_664g00029 [Paralvinella palmiformis]
MPYLTHKNRSPSDDVNLDPFSPFNMSCCNPILITGASYTQFVSAVFKIEFSFRRHEEIVCRGYSEYKISCEDSGPKVVDVIAGVAFVVVAVAADQAKGISIVKERSKCEGEGKVKVENVALERKVGLLSSIGLIVGIIIGSGIFISPTGVAEGAGSVGLSLILWGIGGIITLLVVVAVINITSVRLAANIQVIFLIAKVLALVIIIIGGIVNMINGKLEYIQSGFDGTSTNPGQIMLGLYSAMFAYDGWNNLNFVMDEVINPAWTLPMAMYIGMPLVIVLYMLTNVSYLTVMDVPTLVNSPAVAMTWAERVIPQVSWLIPVSVAMSAFGGFNGSIFTVGRLFYTAAKGGHMPKIVSYIHIKRITPMPAIMITTFFTIFYSLLGQVTALIDFLSFAIWLFYGVTMTTFLVMRFKEPFRSMTRPYKAPIVFPIIVLLFSVAMVVIPIATAPQIEFLYATVIMLAGFIFYFPFIYFKVKVPCMNKVTCFLQLLMQVVPPGDLSEDDHDNDITSTKSAKTD